MDKQCDLCNQPIEWSESGWEHKCPPNRATHHPLPRMSNDEWLQWLSKAWFVDKAPIEPGWSAPVPSVHWGTSDWGDVATRYRKVDAAMVLVFHDDIREGETWVDARDRIMPDMRHRAWMDDIDTKEVLRGLEDA